MKVKDEVRRRGNGGKSSVGGRGGGHGSYEETTSL